MGEKKNPKPKNKTNQKIKKQGKKKTPKETVKKRMYVYQLFPFSKTQPHTYTLSLSVLKKTSLTYSNA